MSVFAGLVNKTAPTPDARPAMTMLARIADPSSKVLSPMPYALLGKAGDQSVTLKISNNWYTVGAGNAEFASERAAACV